MFVETKIEKTELLFLIVQNTYNSLVDYIKDSNYKSYFYAYLLLYVQAFDCSYWLERLQNRQNLVAFQSYLLHQHKLSHKIIE